MLLVSAVREELGDLTGETIGIGPILSAIRAAAVIERLKPKHVVLLGTAAAYPGGPEIGTAVVAIRVGLSSGVAAMGLGYVPRPLGSVSCDAVPFASLALKEVPVLSVAALTTDAKLANRLSDGWSVEHMEAYGVALACKEANIPFSAVLGIASRVGPENHTLWLSNRNRAQDVARDAIRRMFES